MMIGAMGDFFSFEVGFVFRGGLTTEQVDYPAWLQPSSGLS